MPQLNKKRLLVAIFCLLFGFVAPSLAQNQEKDELTAQERTKIDQLLKDLDSAEFKTREDALTSLKKLGTKAHPHIRASLGTLPINARMQVESLLEDQAEDRNRFNADLKGTKIKIAPGELTVQDVMNLLSREAGYRFVKNPGIEVKKTVFFEPGEWRALQLMDSLCIKAGVRWTQDYNTGAIRFYRNAVVGKPVEIYQGAFRVSLHSMSMNTNLQFGADSTSNCYVRGQFDIEPLADVCGVIFQPEVMTIEDDQGRSLKIEAPAAQSFQTATNRRNFNFNLRLEQPQKDAKRIKLLKVKVPVVVPTALETAIVPLNQKPDDKAAPVGPLQVELIRIDKAGNKRFVNLKLNRRLPKIEVGRIVEVTSQEISLIDGQGGTTPVYSRVSRGRSQKKDTMRFEIPEGKWESIQLTQVVRVEKRPLIFEFRDIDLP